MNQISSSWLSLKRFIASLFNPDLTSPNRFTMQKRDIEDADFELLDKATKRKTYILIGVTCLIFLALMVLVSTLSSCSLTLQNVNVEDVRASGEVESIFPPTYPLKDAS